MNAKFIREEVEAFRIKDAPDHAPEDCFPAWFLQQTYGIGAVQALMQSSDPAIVGKSKSDGGLDAYHLEPQVEGRFKILLVQAKYTESVSQIGKGFKDLERCLPHVENVLKGLGSAEVQNKLYANLRAAVQRSQENLKDLGRLDFHLKVIHLCEQDPMIIRANCRKAIDDLKEEFGTRFPEAQCTVEPVGPAQISGTDIVRPGDDWFSLHLSSVRIEVPHGDRQVRMYLGVGRLGELVNLYKQRRDDLFSKNVRYFLRSKKNTETGPSGRIRESLRELCVSPPEVSSPPEMFAFYHNGITLYARDLRLQEQNDTAEVREPFVLNGCQTIKTGYYFRYDTKLAKRIDEVRWDRIAVPLRIITTKDEELIRQITIGNNRQNQISPSALRANDPVQVTLADRFRRRGIFYQRQEGAFEELEETNPAVIEADYPNTHGGYVDVVHLARSLAATAGDLDLAHSPSHIFEPDLSYQKCFSVKRLSSIVLLTFLQNLNDVLSVILKKDLSLEWEGDGPRPARLMYYAMCLLMRYLAKTQEAALVLEYGDAIYGKGYAFRQEVVKRLDNWHSGIKGVLKERFMGLEDARAESLKAAFQKAENVLRLKGSTIDPFETFKELDAQLGE
jgi:hypothetical protein